MAPNNRNSAWLNVSGETSTSERTIMFGVRNPGYRGGELVELLRVCSFAGWDGEDAVPIANKITEYVEKLLQRLPTQYPLPHISPSADGSVVMDWETENMALCVDVQPNEKIRYFCNLGNGNKREREASFADGISSLFSILGSMYAPKILQTPRTPVLEAA